MWAHCFARMRQTENCLEAACFVDFQIMLSHSVIARFVYCHRKGWVLTRVAAAAVVGIVQTDLDC